MILPLAGTPRSGSTLFRSILQQNPSLNVTPYSGLLETLTTTINHWNNDPHKAYARDNALNRVLKSTIEVYHDYPISLDINRSWPSHVELLETLLPGNFNIVCMVRPMVEVIASFEYLTKLNPEKTMILNYGSKTEERVEAYLSGFVGNSYRSMIDALDRSLGDRLLFVNYRDFIANPTYEIEKMSKHWNISFYEYIPVPTPLINEENDNAHGMLLHTIKPEIKTYSPKPEEILGKRICSIIEHQYPSFWEKK